MVQRQALQRQQPALRQALDALERQSVAQHQAVERNVATRRPSPNQNMPQYEEELSPSAHFPVYQLPMTIPQPLPMPQRRKGGIRNLFVVVLCLGVLGFSGHVVSQQWSRSPNGSVVAIQQAHAEVPANTHKDTARLSTQQVATSSASSVDVDQTAAITTTSSSNTAPTADASIDLDKELPVSAPQRPATQTADAAEPAEEAWGAIVTTQSTTQTSAVEEKPASKISRDEEQRLMRSATLCLQLGNISCARRYFTQLAEQDSAIGAVSLAKTFDPNVMDKASLKGASTDVKKAREWYEKAEQLGNNEAAAHLKKL
jgi:hypothetical protein